VSERERRSARVIGGGGRSAGVIGGESGRRWVKGENVVLWVCKCNTRKKRKGTKGHVWEFLKK
jgi:hypothetical protein